MAGERTYEHKQFCDEKTSNIKFKDASWKHAMKPDTKVLRNALFQEHTTKIDVSVTIETLLGGKHAHLSLGAMQVM